MSEVDLRLTDGRVLHGADDGPAAGDRALLWLHGTPGTGRLPVPLAAVAADLGLRRFAFDRAGYGGSTPRPGRSPADTAADAVALADHLGIGRFLLAGHSGGASHALALAAAHPDRVEAVLAVSALAPPAVLPGDAWFTGMGPAGTATLRAALAGRAAREAHAGTDASDFTAADWAALEGEWGWLGEIAGEGSAHGPGPLVDDDLAYVGDWGVDLTAVRARVLLLHGADDLVAPLGHARRLAAVLPDADLRVVEGAGHVSVLTGAATALRDLAAHR